MAQPPWSWGKWEPVAQGGQAACLRPWQPHPLGNGAWCARELQDRVSTRDSVH